MLESPFAVFWVVDLIGQRPAIGQASAAVLIVLIIAVSGVTVEGIQASRGQGPTKTVTVFDTSTSVVASQNTSQFGAAQVAVTTVYLLATSFGTSGTTSTFACATGPGSSPFLALTNVGTQASSVTGITITWAGSTSDYSPVASCVVGPAGSATSTSYVVFPDSSAINADPVTGQSFSGTIAMSNGALLLFTGSWGEPAGTSPSAQVSVTSVNAPHGDFATNGGGSSFVCSTSPGTSAYLVLTNTGTAAVSVTGVTISWAGSNNAFSPAASCSVGAAGAMTASIYLNLPNPATLSSPAVAGQIFEGTVTLSNGADVVFTWTFT